MLRRTCTHFHPCSLVPLAPPAVELGSYGVVPNYFEQNQAQALDLNLTVIETLVRWGWPAAGRAGAQAPVWQGS